MVGALDDQATRQICATRLLHALTESAKVASQSGLTPKALSELLKDES